MPRLSPKERWDLIKQGKDPDKSPESQQNPTKNSKQPQVPTEKDYRRPGEPCDHPAHMITWDESPGLGKLKICKACGRILNDPDMRS